MKFHGFKTGSRVWGVNYASSDYDCCVLAEEAERLKLLYPDYEQEVSKYENQTFYISEGLGRFNIITLTPGQMIDWKHATEKLKDYPQYQLVDRAHRIALFEQYKQESHHGRNPF